MDVGAAQRPRQAPCAPTTASRPTSRRGGARGRSSSPGAPFERVLREHRTEVALAEAGAGTEVTLTVEQRARGTAKLGGFMVRRATARRLDEALVRPRGGAVDARAGLLGLGRAGVGARAARARRRRSCARRWACPAAWSRRRCRSRRVVAARAARCRRRCGSELEAIGVDGARRPRSARAALPRQELPRPAGPARGATASRRPTPSCARATHEQVQAVLRAVRRGRRGGGAVRRRHERGRRPGGGARRLRGRDLARPRADGPAGLRRRALADRACSSPGSACRRPTGRWREHGLTLAHVPQSYEWATVGGCVATRSAGQSSTGNGRIDENVVALRCATPAGDDRHARRARHRRRAVAARAARSAPRARSA